MWGQHAHGGLLASETFPLTRIRGSMKFCWSSTSDMCWQESKNPWRFLLVRICSWHSWHRHFPSRIMMNPALEVVVHQALGIGNMRADSPRVLWILRNSHTVTDMAWPNLVLKEHAQVLGEHHSMPWGLQEEVGSFCPVQHSNHQTSPLRHDLPQLLSKSRARVILRAKNGLQTQRGQGLQLIGELKGVRNAKSLDGVDCQTSVDRIHIRGNIRTTIFWSSGNPANLPARVLITSAFESTRS